MIEILQTLAANPAFAGVIGAGAVGSVLYQLRAVPSAIYTFGKRHSVLTMEVDNSQQVFDQLCLYLSRSAYAKKARWLKMAEIWDDDLEKWVWAPSFGRGWHFFKDRGDWFLIHRNIQDNDKGGESLKPRESFQLMSFGRSQRALRELMLRAEKAYDRENTLPVHIWHRSSYMLADRKPLRSLDTVFIPEDQKHRVVRDLLNFMDSKAEYRRKGTPYRRGYLLEGPPGTGKTTLIFALACLVSKPVRLINLHTVGGDTGLQAAFNEAGSDSIVVIEDIDTVKVSQKRVPTKGSYSAKEEVTLSGLLNAVDGIAARDGRILFITSNHADRLDPALIRPGRVDVREVIDLIHEPQAREMTKLFLPNKGEEWFTENVLPLLPLAPAALQEHLIQWGVENVA